MRIRIERVAMLDDVAAMIDKDPSDMIGSAQQSYRQLAHPFQVTLNLATDSPPFEKIAYFGMGGSALGAMLFAHWQYSKLSIPFSVYREYDIPAWVDEHTLAIVATYSGNTEEALSTLDQLHKKGIRTVTIAHGGQLADVAHEKHLTHLHLPPAPQPRMAVLSTLRAVAEIVETATGAKGLTGALEDAARRLPQSISGWRREVPLEHNYAKQLARQCMGKSVVIYGGPLLAAAAYKWKIDFNENAKNLAFWGQWPEVSHNDLFGWSPHPIEKPFAIIELTSSFERPRIHQRISIANRLLSGMMPEPWVVECYGDTDVEQLLWAVILGDHVSTYLGLLNGHNPAPVKLIEKFKKELYELDEAS